MNPIPSLISIYQTVWLLLQRIEKELEKAAEPDVEEPKPKAVPSKSAEQDSIMNDLSAKSKALLKNLQKEIIADGNDLPKT